MTIFFAKLNGDLTEVEFNSTRAITDIISEISEEFGLMYDDGAIELHYNGNKCLLKYFDEQWFFFKLGEIPYAVGPPPEELGWIHNDINDTFTSLGINDESIIDIIILDKTPVEVLSTCKFLTNPMLKVLMRR